MLKIKPNTPLYFQPTVRQVDLVHAAKQLKKLCKLSW